MDFDREFFSRENRQLAYFNRCSGHIRNPGMGIVSMLASDHMVKSTTAEEERIAHCEPPHYPTDDELTAATDNPFTDHLYIRVGWSDVQREAGKLCFSPVFERALEQVRRSGKTWSMRIMQNSPSGPKGNYIPEFLQGRLPLIELDIPGSHGGRNFLPAYTDEYLKYWDEMLHLMGEEFDCDPMLEYADVSGFGFWGEGHHCGQTILRQDVGEGFGTADEHEKAVERLIDSHASAFEKTPMSVNLHLCDYEAGRRAVENGAWCRRDSYYTYFKSYEAQYGLMRRPDAALIYETVIVRRNPPHRSADSTNSFRSCLELPDLKCDYGCNYGVIGFNPADTIFSYETAPEVFERFAERVGYRIRPSVIWESVSENGSHHLTLGMVNDGCANAPGDLLIKAECSGKSACVTVNGGEIGGRMKIVDMPLPDGFRGKCSLKMFLVNKKRTAPVRWATDCADGRAPIALTFDI